MNISGHPVSPSASAAMPELAERFWYWRGASGRDYIHSVYTPESCPPLPGAVYIGVNRTGTLRVALTVGRFSPFLMMPDLSGCNEVHVHLMAKSPEAAEGVRQDLLTAMGVAVEEMGLAEDAPAWPLAA